MTGLLIALSITACAVAGWYLFEWFWNRRLFPRGEADHPENFSRNLRARQVREVIEASPALRIVDVRPAGHFGRGAIPGAENIPFTGPEFEEQVAANLSPDEPLLIYCSGGFRSRLAAGELRRLGYRKLYHLHRGIGSWKLGGYPVETQSAPD